MQRCVWCNVNNPIYVRYHDEEWCRPNFDDHYLYEMLILESFQAGLSWECILNKRENFRKAYDNFDINAVCSYGESKIQTLLQNAGIVRNALKIRASIQNSKIFRSIVREYGTFYAYLTVYTGPSVRYELEATRNAVSDALAHDLRQRGMKFVGSTTLYAYLQAIGCIYSHDRRCFLYRQG